jgi:hypothetical protein
MPSQIDMTVTDTTVDELYEDLGKLKVMGLGAWRIDWHTSRTHIGRTVKMTITEHEQEKQRQSAAGGKEGTK